MSVPIIVLIFGAGLLVLLLVSWFDRGKMIGELFDLIEQRDRFRDTLIREAEENRQTIATAQRALFQINAYPGDNIVAIEKVASDALHAMGLG